MEYERMNRFTEQTPSISSVEEIKEKPAHWHTMAMTTSEIAENDGESADGAFKVDILCALFGSERLVRMGCWHRAARI